ncbi:hypothetical protein [Halorubrum vacuolatum]|uniref:hypothetical protein n=1 Tax=Halorubrum vacuolatum TaxID=63740 RepID=UPI00117B9CD0|nr:hypothetical protein [Halorubrum vacuolatum]
MTRHGGIKRSPSFESTRLGRLQRSGLFLGANIEQSAVERRSRGFKERGHEAERRRKGPVTVEATILPRVILVIRGETRLPRSETTVDDEIVASHI